MAEKVRSRMNVVSAFFVAVAFTMFMGVMDSSQPTEAAAVSVASSWSTPQVLAEGAQNPTIAVNADGEFVAMWTKNRSLFSSQSRDGRTWSSPVTVFSSGFYGPFSVKLSVNAAGRFVVAWFDDTDQTPVLYSASSVDGQTWSTPTRLSEVADPSTNMVLVTNANSAGVELVTLARTSTLGESRIVSFHSSDGLTWPSTPDNVSPVTSSELIDLCGAMTSTGEVSVAWTTYDSSQPTAVMYSANRSAGGTWSVSVSLADKGYPVGLAVNQAGMRVMVWADNSGAWQIKGMTSTDGVNWSVPGLIATGYPQFSQLAVGLSGRFVYSWAVYSSLENDLFASDTSNGTSWSAPTTIAGPTEGTSYTSLASDGVDAFNLTYDRASSAGVAIKNEQSESGSSWLSPTVFSTAPVASSGRIASAGIATNKFVVLYSFTTSVIAQSDLYVVTNIPATIPDTGQTTLANTGGTPYFGLVTAVLTLIAGYALIWSRRHRSLKQPS